MVDVWACTSLCNVCMVPISWSAHLELSFHLVSAPFFGEAGNHTARCGLHCLNPFPWPLAASELTEIKSAVTGLKDALEGVRNNNDTSRVALVRLSLKEARDLLSRRLNEISPATALEPSVTAAAREARILLDEVDAQFFA